MRLLSQLLKRFVDKGRLTVIDHDGTGYAFGSGSEGPDVTIRLTDSRVSRDLFFNPELVAAEAYMDGRMVFESGSTVYDLLYLFSINRSGLATHPVQQVLRRALLSVKRFQQRNPIGRAAKNAREHYDHPAEFYALFLDEAMNYSCAYFPEPDISLEDAQRAKLRHIAAKLDLKPGMEVADIGSGWGAMAIYLAQHADVRITGINVSPEQISEARKRADAAGVSNRVTFVENDYREVDGQFDRVVSVGMMEHVGVQYFDVYFEAVERMLKPDGYALIHAIGRMKPPNTTPPFIRKYIFPGGYVPAMNEVFASTERRALWVADCEILRLHYYWTLKHWRERFEARRSEAVDMMGERFARMWEFYLAASELIFLNGSGMVYQLLLAKTRDAVPVTRDFITNNERTLAGDQAVAPVVPD